MKVKNAPTDFARCISRFLTSYLPGERNLSPHTIRSYSMALKMFIEYLCASSTIKPEYVALKDVTSDRVRSFLASISASKDASPSTHNQRLSALKSFARYAILEYPAFFQDGQRILAIPSKRKPVHEIVYLEKEAMKALLAVPDQTTQRGRRDLAIMALLYDTGARVQELIDLKIKNIRLAKPGTVSLLGKGRKMRTIPIMIETAKIVEVYMRDQGFLNLSSYGELHLFNSANRARFTRPGIAKILERHFETAKKINPMIIFPEKVHPHAIRASRAIHLLESGINVIAIRDFLGHASVATTQVYLHVNNEDKRGAIEKAYPSLIKEVPDWRHNGDLMALLREMCT